ncbi:MAG: penicillin acylase family protein, partial [Thermodesulfobacteriota bacterium]
LEDIIALSIQQTFSELKKRLGNDMTQWHWADLHTLTFEHVLGKKKPLDRIFNLGPFEVGGNALTINKKQYPLTQPFGVTHGVSMRLIVDLSDMNGSLHVLPTGQSGQLRSPHYRDQLPLYLSGRYHPAWPNRTDAEAHQSGTLTLTPG